VAGKPLSYEAAIAVVTLVQQCMDDGFVLRGSPSAITEASRRSGSNHQTIRTQLATAKRHHKLEPVDKRAKAPAKDLPEIIRQELMKAPRTLAELVSKADSNLAAVLDAIEELGSGGTALLRHGDRWEIPKHHEPAYISKPTLQFQFDADHRMKFGVIADNHAGSKYTRLDVLNDLYDRFERAGVTEVYHCGNWIEGEASFNKYDVDVRGLHSQCKNLAQTYPRREGITTYAVWGDDHEGWYAQREGVDVGQYAQQIMRQEGREDWVDLGYIEAIVDLVNAESGAIARMNVQHAGGGTAYALSYRPQKIIESLEGGEKPAIILIGHYHKMDPGLVRNVWYLQPGCCQDQTPFMRKKAIEAHIGGVLVECEQDPWSGAVVEFTPRMRRYFNKDFYQNPNNRWSKHGPVNQIKRTVMGV
jgi:predicted phosphodiesterase